MKWYALLCAGLAGCFSEGSEPGYEYDCRLVYACGYEGEAHHITIRGTFEEVSVIVDEWVEACADLAPTPGNGCEITFCGAFCSAN